MGNITLVHSTLCNFCRTAKKLLILSLLMALLGGCSSYRVITDFDQQASFSGLNTFNWFAEVNHQAASPEAPSPLLVQRIKRAINSELANQGFVLVEADAQSDFKVNVVLSNRKKQGVRSRPFSFGVGLGIYHDHFLFTNSYETYEITEGSLAIDIYEGRDNSPIWRGSANKNFIGFDQDVSVATVQEVVRSILATFPPVDK